MKCAECGGELTTGYMYGNRPIAGTADLHLIFGRHQKLIKELFPDGLPKRGHPISFCEKCFKVAK